MESSDGEDSFAWTGASSDSDSDAMAIENTNKKSTQIEYDGESESGSSYKKKLQKKLFRDEQNSSFEKEHKKSKKRKIKEELSDSETKSKRIKIEPESDADVKSKKKSSSYMNGGEDVPGSNDDSYLDLRVKQEQAVFATPHPVKPKKTKKIKNDPNASLESDSQHDSSFTETSESKRKHSTQSIENESELNGIDEESHVTDDSDRQVKKKKKSKKKRNSSVGDEADVTVEDKFEAEETVVETPHKKKKKRKTESETSFNDVTVDNSTETPEHNKTSNRESPEPDDRDMSPVGDADAEIVDSTLNVSKDVAQNTKRNNSSAVNNNNSDSELSDEHNQTHKQKSNYKKINKSHRLSDRIRFEDEHTTEMNTSHMHNNQNALPIEVQNFVETNNCLRQISNVQASDSIISDDDEIWILKCPQETDVMALKGINLNLNNKSKIKFGGNTYDGSIDEEPGCIALLTSRGNKLVMENLSFQGTVNFRKRIPKPHVPEDNVMANNQTNFIPLPDTKCRHPLFGPDYKRAIKIAPAVLDKLRSTDSVDCLDSAKKKKKKKHKKEKSEPLEEEEMPVTKPEPELEPQADGELTVKKKKRKRKHSEEADSTPQKAKRVKHDRNSAEVWESEKAIEESLFNF